MQKKHTRTRLGGREKCGLQLNAVGCAEVNHALGGKGCRSADERHQHEEPEVATFHRSLLGRTHDRRFARGPQAEPRHKSPRPDRRGRLSLRGFVGCTTLCEQTTEFLRQCWFRLLTRVPDIYIV